MALSKHNQASSYRSHEDSLNHWRTYRQTETEKRLAHLRNRDGNFSQNNRSNDDDDDDDFAADAIRTIRVFISSTFIDEHAERDVLIRKVFPELNVLLRPRRIQLVPVDLRWGVSTEQTRVIQQTCLNEIDRCRFRADEAPWFIALRGERYGWVQEKYEPVKDFSLPDNFLWLDNLDTNAQLSITSMEIYHAIVGLSHIPATTPAGEINPHAFVYFRNPDFKSNVAPDFRWAFDFEYKSPEEMDDVPPHLSLQYASTPSAPAYFADMQLLNHILRSSKDVCHSRDYFPSFGVEGDQSNVIQTGQLPSGKKFVCGWVGSMEAFQAQVLQDLMCAIDREYPLSLNAVSHIDPLDADTRQHSFLIHSRAKGFIGRSGLLAQISKHCASVDGLLMVWGGSGSGKSSVIAKICLMFPKRFSSSSSSKSSSSSSSSSNTSESGTPSSSISPASLFVVHHIVGANSASCTLRGMLRRLALEIQRGVGVEVDTDPPHELNDLQKHFLNVLHLSAAKCRVLIIIDAINQLADNPADNLSWLPVEPWPKNVCIVISTVPTENNLLHVLRLRQPPPAEVEVEPMSREEAELMVATILAKYHKELTNEDHPVLGNQMNALMSKLHSNLPVYLVAAIEELRNFGIWEKLSNFLSSQLPDTISRIFNFVLDRLEVDHGKELVGYTLSLVASTRTGLSEMELIEILDQYVTYTVDPISNFSRLYFGLSIFINTGGSGLLQIFHSQLLAIVRSRYLVDVDQGELALPELVSPSFHSKLSEKIHLILSRYFRDKANPDPSNAWSGDSPRAFSEIIYHLSRSDLTLALETLKDIRFLAAKCKFGMAHELADDLFAIDRIFETKAGDTAAPNEVAKFNQSSALVEKMEEKEANVDPELYDDFLRIKRFYLSSLHIITAAPHQFYNQALRCAESSPIWKQADEVFRKGIAPCLRVDWTNRSRLESDCEFTITTSPSAFSISYDCKYIATGGADGLFLWDLRSGRLVKRLEGHAPDNDGKKRNVLFVVYSPRGEWLATSTRDEVIVWNTLSYQPHWRHSFGLSFVSFLSFNPAKSHHLAIATGGYPRALVSVWDISVSESKFQSQIGHLKDSAMELLKPHAHILADNAVEFSALYQLFPFHTNVYHRRAPVASHGGGFTAFLQEYDEKLRDKVTPLQTKDEVIARKKAAANFLNSVGKDLLVDALIDKTVSMQLFVDKLYAPLPISLSVNYFSDRACARECTDRVTFLSWSLDGEYIFEASSSSDSFYIWNARVNNCVEFSLHYLKDPLASVGLHGDQLVFATMSSGIYTAKFDLIALRSRLEKLKEEQLASISHLPEWITKQQFQDEKDKSSSLIPDSFHHRRCFSYFDTEVDGDDEDELEEVRVWTKQFCEMQQMYTTDRKQVSRKLIESRLALYTPRKMKNLFDNLFKMSSIPSADKYTYLNQLYFSPIETESPSGSLLQLVCVATDSDKIPLLIFSFSGNEFKYLFPLVGHSAGVEAISFSRTGRHLVSATKKELKIWNVLNSLNALRATPPSTLKENEDSHNEKEKDGEKEEEGSGDEQEDGESGEKQKSISDHPEGIYYSTFLWDEDLAYTIDLDGKILCWDFARTHNAHPPLPPQRSNLFFIPSEKNPDRPLSIDTLSLGENHKMIHWSGDEMFIISFDPVSRKIKVDAKYEGGHQQGGICDAVFPVGYNNRYLITGGDEDRSICVWDFDDLEGPKARRDAFVNRLSSLAEEINGEKYVHKSKLTENEEWLPSELYDNPNEYEAQLYFWITSPSLLTNDQKDERKDLFADHPERFSPNLESVLLSVLIKLWDYQTLEGRRIHRFHRIHDAGNVKLSCLSNDIVVSSSKGGDLCVSNWRKGELLARLPSWRGMLAPDFKTTLEMCSANQFAFDDDHVLLSYRDGSLRVFHIPSILELSQKIRGAISSPLTSPSCYADSTLVKQTITVQDYHSHLPALPLIDVDSEQWGKVTRLNHTYSISRTRVIGENKHYAAVSKNEPKFHTLLGYSVYNSHSYSSILPGVYRKLAWSSNRRLLISLEGNFLRLYRITPRAERIVLLGEYVTENHTFDTMCVSNEGKVILGSGRGDVFHFTFHLPNSFE